MDEQNRQTAVKEKKKHSFLWLKILFFVVLIAGGVVLGLWVSTQDLPVNPVVIIFGENAQSKTAETHEAENTDKQLSPVPTVKPAETAPAIVKPTESPAAARNTAKPESPAAAEAKDGKTEEAKTASANGEFIGVDRALEAALLKAGIDEADAQIYGVYRDDEDGVTVYKVEFSRDGRSYIFDVNAETGEIEGWKSYPLSDGQYFDERYDGTDTQSNGAFPKMSEELYNYLFGGAENQNKTSGKPASGAQAESEPAETAIPKANAAAGSNLPELVNTSFAKEVCFQHAGTSADAVNDLKTELELEKNMLVYDIEFRYNGYKYEYLVDAVNGDIVKSDKEKY